MVGVVVLVAVAHRPEVGALLFVCAATAVPHHVLFDRGVPAFGGALKVTDMLLLATLASWLAHAALVRGTVRYLYRATTFLVVFGIAIAILTSGLRTGMERLLISPSSSSAAALVPTDLSDCQRRPLFREAELGVTLYLVAASVACLITVWRYAHGEGSAASYTSGAIRVIDSVLLISAMLAGIWAVVLVPTTRKPLTVALLSALVILSLAALFFTFQRTAWVAFLAGARPTPPPYCARSASPTCGKSASGARRSDGRCARGKCRHEAEIGSRSTALCPDTANVGRGLQQGRLRSLPHRRVESSRRSDRAPPSDPGIGLGNTITFWSPMYSPSPRT